MGGGGGRSGQPTTVTKEASLVAGGARCSVEAQKRMTKSRPTIMERVVAGNRGPGASAPTAGQGLWVFGLCGRALAKARRGWVHV